MASCPKEVLAYADRIRIPLSRIRYFGDTYEIYDRFDFNFGEIERYAKDFYRNVSGAESFLRHAYNQYYDLHNLLSRRSRLGYRLHNMDDHAIVKMAAQQLASGDLVAVKAGALEKTGVVVVIIKNNGITGHAGVMVGKGRHAILYDPGGEYKQNAGKGSDDCLYGPEANLEDYVRYQQKDGPLVKTYTFRITKDEEEKIKNNIDRRYYEKHGCIPTKCALCVSDVLGGVGPFKGLTASRWPSSLAEKMEAIQRR